MIEAAALSALSGLWEGDPALAAVVLDRGSNSVVFWHRSIVRTSTAKDEKRLAWKAQLQTDPRMGYESLRWICRGEVGGKYRVYADHVVEGLREISDEDVQRERWLVGPSSLSEAWEQVFDDSGLTFVLDHPDAARLLTPSLAAAFEALGQALRRKRRRGSVPRKDHRRPSDDDRPHGCRAGISAPSRAGREIAAPDEERTFTT